MLLPQAANSNGNCPLVHAEPRADRSRSREDATRRWIRNLVSQLLEHLPYPAVLTSSDLDRIICANGNAASWLLPRIGTGPGSHLSGVVGMNDSVRELARTRPDLLPLRTLATINGRLVTCRIHMIHSGAGDRLRLITWDE